MLQKPVVHLNGSGEKNLREQWAEAYSRIGDAIKAVQQTAPHMRDFYVLQGGGKAEYQQARTEHESRIQRLEAIRDEFLELVGSLNG